MDTAAQKTSQLQSPATCTFPDAAEHDPPRCRGGSLFYKGWEEPRGVSQALSHSFSFQQQIYPRHDTGSSGRTRKHQSRDFPSHKMLFSPPLLCPGVPKQEDVEAEEPTWVFFPRTSLNFRLFPQERQTHSWSESPGSPSSRYLQDGNASSAFIKQEPLVSSSHGNSSLPMGKAWDNVPGVGKDYPSIRRKQSSSTITEQAVLPGTGEIKGINEGIGSTKKALTGAKPKHRIPGI